MTYICLGHLFGHLKKESTKNKICIFQVPTIVEKIVLIKIKQLSVYLLTQFNNTYITNYGRMDPNSKYFTKCIDEKVDIVKKQIQFYMY